MLLKKFINIMRNLFCIAGLILMLPVLVIVVLMVLIEDGLPILFIQKRIGKDQSAFKIIKIRTLKRDTPNTGTHELDKRNFLVTGRIIRKIKLDELPQLINVLKGDINLIGPRPGLPSQAVLANARESRNIYKTKPGITGLAQVLGYDMSDPEKLAEIDEIYIKQRSVRVNLLILIGTFIRYPKKYLNNLIEANENDKEFL
jgi:O-antigen biosynthesis protein WbqP